MSRTRISRRNLLGGLGAGLAATALPTAAFAHSGDPEYFEITRRERVIEGLDPVHDGLVVAHLTDLHVGDETPDGRLLSVLRAVREAKPDLVVLTGDYVTHSRAPLDHIPVVLAHLPGPAIAVLGNHDHYVDAPAVTKRMEAIGARVLRNQHTQVELRGKPLRVVGIDDGQSRHADPKLAFEGVPESEGALVLMHAPPTADLLPTNRGFLALAGHTHGGHMRFGVVTDSILRKFGQPYVRGDYRVRGNGLYVSRGLGFGDGTRLPRINADPELAFHVLRSAEVLRSVG